MADMVERVARAICEAIPFGVDQVDAAKAARAAIEALREPTEAVCEAGANVLDVLAFDMEVAWPAMIDAILKERD